MANILYDKARQRFLEGEFNWLTDNVRTLMIDAGAYAVSSAHEFLASVPAGARITSPVTLTGKASTNGAADAADVTFPAVSGPTIEAIVLYKEVQNAGVADDSVSPLIAYIDTATGLPITPNGGDIIVTWDNGSNKLFRL